jgi:hypothetical protein
MSRCPQCHQKKNHKLGCTDPSAQIERLQNLLEVKAKELLEANEKLKLAGMSLDASVQVVIEELASELTRERAKTKKWDRVRAAYLRNDIHGDDGIFACLGRMVKDYDIPNVPESTREAIIDRLEALVSIAPDGDRFELLFDGQWLLSFDTMDVAEHVVTRIKASMRKAVDTAGTGYGNKFGRALEQIVWLLEDIGSVNQETASAALDVAKAALKGK